jgi:phage gp37-like protein
MTPEQPDTEQRSNVRDAAADAGVGAEAVRRRVQARSARIERREVEDGLAKLDAYGDLTAEQRQVVRLLGATIARRLTPVPEPALERDDCADEEFIRTVARLFDVAHRSHPDVTHQRS